MVHPLHSNVREIAWRYCCTFWDPESLMMGARRGNVSRYSRAKKEAALPTHRCNRNRRPTHNAARAYGCR